MFAEAAQVFLDAFGEPVVFYPHDEMSKPMTAMVEDFGMSDIPAGWPGPPVFEGTGRYAEIRVRPVDVGREPTKADAFRCGELEYEIRAVSPLPRRGSDQAWWSCLCVAQQGGVYR